MCNRFFETDYIYMCDNLTEVIWTQIDIIWIFVLKLQLVLPAVILCGALINIAQRVTYT